MTNTFSSSTRINLTPNIHTNSLTLPPKLNPPLLTSPSKYKLVQPDRVNSNPLSAITAGGLHSCLVLESGSLQCFGSNEFKQCELPSNLRGPKARVEVVDAGMSHSCALNKDGELTCWGWNLHGQAESVRKDDVSWINDQDKSQTSLIMEAANMINDEGSNIKEVVERVIKNKSLDFDPDLQDEIMDHVNQYTDQRSEKNRARLYGSLKKLIDEKVKSIVAKVEKQKSSTNDSGKKDNLQLKSSNSDRTYKAQFNQNSNDSSKQKSESKSNSSNSKSPKPPSKSDQPSPTSTDSINNKPPKSPPLKPLNPKSNQNIDSTNRPTPIPTPKLILKFTMIATGGCHTCTRSSADQLSYLLCWGSKLKLQTEVPLAMRRGARQVSAGFEHNIGIDKENNAHCWGSNQFGQCDIPQGVQEVVVKMHQQNGEGGDWDRDDRGGKGGEAGSRENYNNGGSGISKGKGSGKGDKGSEQSYKVINDLIKDKIEGQKSQNQDVHNDYQNLNYEYPDLPQNKRRKQHLEKNIHQNLKTPNNQNINLKIPPQLTPLKMKNNKKSPSQSPSLKPSNSNSKPKPLDIQDQTLQFCTVRAGLIHSCGITYIGTLVCWGSNFEGQLTVPRKYLQGSITVAVGVGDTCAVDGFGMLDCFGSNRYQMKDVPQEMQSHALTVRLGFQHAVGLDWNMVGRCWGKAELGQCNSMGEGVGGEGEGEGGRREGRDRDFEVEERGEGADEEEDEGDIVQGSRLNAHAHRHADEWSDDEDQDGQLNELD